MTLRVTHVTTVGFLALSPTGKKYGATMHYATEDVAAVERYLAQLPKIAELLSVLAPPHLSELRHYGPLDPAFVTCFPPCRTSGSEARFQATAVRVEVDSSMSGGIDGRWLLYRTTDLEAVKRHVHKELYLPHRANGMGYDKPFLHTVDPHDPRLICFPACP